MSSSSGAAATGAQPAAAEKKLTKEELSIANDYRNADCCSQIVLHWASRLVCQSFRSAIELAQMWVFPRRLTAARSFERLSRYYDKELEKPVNERSLKRALLKTFAFDLFKPVLWKCLWITAVSITAAICLRGILSEISGDGLTLTEVTPGNFVPLDAILYTCGFVLTESTRSLCHTNFWWAGVMVGTKMRSSLRMLILDKTLSMSTAQSGTGQGLNFVTNFAERIYYAAYHAVFVISCPATLIVAIALAIDIVGVAALAGFAMLAILTPVQWAIGKCVGEVRRSTIKVTDERIGLMDEILSAIKLIKLYAWESAFASKTAEIRDRERILLQRAAIAKVFNRALSESSSVLVTAAMFGTHLAINNEMLSVTQTYTAMALFNMCRFPLAVMPQSVRMIAEAFVGLERVNKFLNDAVTRRDLTLEQNDTKDDSQDVVYGIDVENANCKWIHDSQIAIHEAEGEAKGSGKKGQAEKSGKEGVEMEEVAKGEAGHRDDETGNSGFLRDVTLKVPQGSLLAVVGPVGAGKTSVLEGLLLGHMQLTSGSVTLRGKSVAYCAQSPWIFSATLRENITFECLSETEGGQKESKQDIESRYQEALSAACLRPDLRALPAGDQTEIGERGINLSGGQKARVALGRAVFANADIVLLDDPLSAVDAQVGRHLFEQCMGPSGVLVQRNPKCTRVLVTHQVQFLAQCDLVCIVADGRVKAMGTFEELRESGQFSAQTLQRQLSADTDEAKQETSSIDAEQKVNGDGGEGDIDQKQSEQEEVVAVADGSSKSAKLVPLSDSDKSEPSDDAGKQKQSAGGKLVEAESRQKGAVSSVVVCKYFEAMGPCCVPVCFITSFLLPQCLRVVHDFWLLIWLSDGINSGVGLDLWLNSSAAAVSPELVRNESSEDYFPQTYYYAVYACIVLSMFLMSISQLSFVQCTLLRAGSALHDRVFRVVLGGTMAFFDTRPTGRILNNFGSDMDQIDVNLPDVFEITTTITFFVVFTIAVIAVVLPWFLVPLCVIFCVYIGLTCLFRRAVREFKRTDAIAKSPLYTHVQNSVSGLATIAAYGKGVAYMSHFAHLADRSSQTWFAFNAVSRWFGYRIDFLTTLVVSSTALICILTPAIPSASAGLVITYSLQTAGVTQYMTRLFSETEAYLTAVERLTDFEDSTPQEPSVEKSIVTEAESTASQSDASKRSSKRGKRLRKLSDRSDFLEDWPRPKGTTGKLEVRQYSTRYRPGLPLVLRDVSFTVQPGESIGIVGRTGSGKSSLTMAIYRIISAASGSIFLDDQDIAGIPLQQLRSHLAIIPQDPVLFCGTVRSNLDPFDEHEDADLWAALGKVEMQQFVSSLPEAMAAPVTEGGSNFSQGQRQLLCFARALLRQGTSLIIMDEATASVDNTTDDVIQNTIQSAFADITVLIVAHRLSTVMGCDKILALSAGQVSEYGTPADLLANPDGETTRLVRETGAQNERFLRKMVSGDISQAGGESAQTSITAEAEGPTRLDAVDETVEEHEPATEVGEEPSTHASEVSEAIDEAREVDGNAAITEVQSPGGDDAETDTQQASEE